MTSKQQDSKEVGILILLDDNGDCLLKSKTKILHRALRSEGMSFYYMFKQKIPDDQWSSLTSQLLAGNTRPQNLEAFKEINQNMRLYVARVDKAFNNVQVGWYEDASFTRISKILKLKKTEIRRVHYNQECSNLNDFFGWIAGRENMSIELDATQAAQPDDGYRDIIRAYRIQEDDTKLRRKTREINERYGPNSSLHRILNVPVSYE